MTPDFLAIRSKMLQDEMARSKSNVAMLTEQLEQAKCNIHMVMGHLNEVNYLLSEAQKANDAAVMDVLKVDTTENHDVETNDEDQE